jgi:hypothetical protein
MGAAPDRQRRAGQGRTPLKPSTPQEEKFPLEACLTKDKSKPNPVIPHAANKAYHNQLSETNSRKVHQQ